MVRIINRAQGLSGLNPLSYLGVESAQFNNTVMPFVAFNTDPTPQDWQNFTLGTIWLRPDTRKVWMLVNLDANVATWVEFTAGSGSILSVLTDSGTANPVAGVIDLFATPNAGHTVAFTASGNIINLNTSDVNNNTTVGLGSGASITSGLANTAFGAFALNKVTSGGQNTAVGLDSLQNLTTGSANTALGVTSGQDLISGSSNTYIGWESGTAATTGSNNIGIGQSSAGLYTTESNNVAIANTGVVGDAAVLRIGNDTTPFTHVFINNAYGDFGTGNTFVGSLAGNVTLTTGSAQFNTGLGANSLFALTTGASNTALGYDSLQNLTTGSTNTCVGLTSGQDLITGSNNTFIGYEAGTNLVSGSNNIGIGQSSGGALATTDSNNICINHPGVPGDNNILRIGNSTTALLKTFIGGIRGKTTDINDAVAVLIDSAGQLGVTSSSARYKDNIEDMGEYSSLLMTLRPVTFNYKEHLPTSISVGLIAEEVDKIMPSLVVYKDTQPETVKYHDLVPMLLNELQKLAKRVEELESSRR